MKKYIYLFVLLVATSFCGCKSSQAPVKTYSMPCAELKSGDGMLRAWAVGKSDSEMAARKKAQVAASAQLAGMLSKVVSSTIEDYTTTVGGKQGVSKTFYNERTQSKVEEVLKGAVMVCDEWHKDKATNQFHNYVVLELRGQDYLDSLYKIIDKDVKLDKEVLNRLFLENVNKSLQAE